MNSILLLLSVAGVVAVLARAVLAGVRLLFRGADSLLAGEVAAQRARRGDLTGVSDADRARREARVRRRGAVAELAVWIGLLAAPPLTPWPEGIYAAYALLWLFPRRRR
jgi:hypothetical protein